MPNVLSTTKAFEYVLPVELKEDKTPELCKELAEKVKNYYYGKETPSKENLKIFTNVNTIKLKHIFKILELINILLLVND